MYSYEQKNVYLLQEECILIAGRMCSYGIKYVGTEIGAYEAVKK